MVSSNERALVLLLGAQGAWEPLPAHDGMSTLAYLGPSGWTAFSGTAVPCCTQDSPGDLPFPAVIAGSQAKASRPGFPHIYGGVSYLGAQPRVVGFWIFFSGACQLLNHVIHTLWFFLMLVLFFLMEKKC